MPQKEDRESGALNAVIGFLSVLLFLLIFGLIARLIYPHIHSSRTAKNHRSLISNVIQVAVLNGCGARGVADKFTSALRRHGFDVVKTGNFKNFNMKHTTVISRLPNSANAEKVAKALGINKAYVITEASKNYYLDVAIVIGSDYHSLKLK
jgi:hypothetical protein